MYAVDSGGSTYADVRFQWAEFARQCRCFSASVLRTFRATFRWSGLINQLFASVLLSLA